MTHRLLSDPHFAERGFFSEIEQTNAGPTLQPGAPIRMTDGWIVSSMAPIIGEHQQELRRRVASKRSDQQTLPLRRSSSGYDSCMGGTVRNSNTWRFGRGRCASRQPMGVSLRQRGNILPAPPKK